MAAKRSRKEEIMDKAITLVSIFKDAFAAANSFGDTDDKIIGILKGSDGTITKDFAFNVALKTIRAMAATTDFDMRNRAAVIRCKGICEDVLGCEPSMDVVAKHENYYGMAVYRGETKRIEAAMKKEGNAIAEDLFVVSVLHEHRTLQQTFVRACIKLVYQSGKYDFSAMGDNEPWRLPMI